jgi:hypothetical protein
MRAASLFLVKVLVIGAVLYFLGIALHELGHLLVAWVTGTHIESFRFYDPRFGGSVVQISGDTPRVVVRVGDFAGGLFSGLVLLGAGFLLRKRFGESALWWIAGLAIAEAGFMELSLGFAEGLDLCLTFCSQKAIMTNVVYSARQFSGGLPCATARLSTPT